MLSPDTRSAHRVDVKSALRVRRVAHGDWALRPSDWHLIVDSAATFPNPPEETGWKPTAPPRRITIVDVARHAQVSTTAVSKVLRNAYGASPTMRAKVRQADRRAGLPAARGRPGHARADLHHRRDAARHPQPVLPRDPRRNHRAAGGTEYQVLLGPGCKGEKAEARVTEAMIDRSMDGIVLIAPISPRAHLEHVAAAVPTVVVGRHGHSAVYDTVADDDIAGAALVVDHLADLGHRRIAHIEHHETDPTASRRCPTPIRAEGYRQAMRAHGLADEIDVVSTSYTQQGGYRGAQQLLARPRRPTAIFAGADIVAMGVLEARRRGRAVRARRHLRRRVRQHHVRRLRPDLTDQRRPGRPADRRQRRPAAAGPDRRPDRPARSSSPPRWCRAGPQLGPPE